MAIGEHIKEHAILGVKDLAYIVANYVPYTGAHSTVDLGSNNLTAAGTISLTGTNTGLLDLSLAQTDPTADSDYQPFLTLSTKTGGTGYAAGGLPSGFSKFRGDEVYTMWTPSSNFTFMGAGVDGDAYMRIRMQASGKMEWGDGTADGDNILSRLGDYGMQIQGDVATPYYWVIDNTNAGAGADTGIALRIDGTTKWAEMVDKTDDVLYFAHTSPWARANALLTLDTSGNLVATGTGDFGSGIYLGTEAGRPFIDGDVASIYSRLFIQPESGNNVMNFFVMPSGTEDKAGFQIRNDSDISNGGRFIMDIDGASAYIKTDHVGSGTGPTSLFIGEKESSGATLRKIKFGFGDEVTYFQIDLDDSGNTALVKDSFHILDTAEGIDNDGKGFGATYLRQQVNNLIWNSQNPATDIYTMANQLYIYGLTADRAQEYGSFNNLLNIRSNKNLSGKGAALRNRVNFHDAADATYSDVNVQFNRVEFDAGATGTVTDLNWAHLGVMSGTCNMTVDTATALKIDALTVGTTKWGIYDAGNNWYCGGDLTTTGTVTIGSDTTGLLDLSPAYNADNQKGNIIKLSDRTGATTEHSGTEFDAGGGYISGFMKFEGSGANPGREFFRLYGDSSSHSLFGGGVNADTYDRFVLRASGEFEWGDGASVRDISMYRRSENNGELFVFEGNQADDFRFAINNLHASGDAVLSWMSETSTKYSMGIDEGDSELLKLTGTSSVTGSPTIMIFDRANTYDVVMPNDDQKLALGAAGATDSYLQFGGTNLEYFSSGLHEFTGGVKIIPNSAVPTANVEFEYKLLGGMISMVMMNFNDNFGIGLGGVYDRLYILNDTAPQLYFADTDNSVNAYLDFDIATDTFRLQQADGGLHLKADDMPLSLGTGKDVSTYFDGED